MKKKLFSVGNGKYLKKEPKIQWNQEIRIAVITSLITLIAGTFFIWNIRNVSPGEYYGSELDRYFRQKIASELDIPNSESNITIDQKAQASASVTLDVDTVIVCGTYTTDSDYTQAGRYISVWERDDSSFWNELFRTEASYSLVFLEISKQEDFMSSTLRCLGCVFDDINDDGDDDICIGYSSKFADRGSIANIFLIRINSVWNIVTPDFSDINSKVHEKIGEQGRVLIDEFYFYRPEDAEDKHTVYSLGMYGTQYQIENPLWEGSDHLYCIAVNNDTSIMDTDHCVLAMMRFSVDNQLIFDPNWNNGEVYVTSYDEVDEDNEIRIVVDDRWGFQIDGFVYYGQDIR